mmetsp:Transcript_88479/g.235432  ORF Transcript_88479/g.235432 Transcript_88479/m.235432 type:complete len:142 (+) Transcript_88479:267-692(+)
MKFRMRTALKCGYDPDNPESLSIKDRPTYMTVVESLIHRRADPNASTLEGLTALHLAAHNGNYKSLWALLQVKGLNLDAVSRYPRPPRRLSGLRQWLSGQSQAVADSVLSQAVTVVGLHSTPSPQALARLLRIPAPAPAQL